VYLGPSAKITGSILASLLALNNPTAPLSVEPKAWLTIV